MKTFVKKHFLQDELHKFQSRTQGSSSLHLRKIRVTEKVNRNTADTLLTEDLSVGSRIVTFRVKREESAVPTLNA